MDLLRVPDTMEAVFKMRYYAPSCRARFQQQSVLLVKPYEHRPATGGRCRRRHSMTAMDATGLIAIGRGLAAILERTNLSND
jgi:hypothetical protein